MTDDKSPDAVASPTDEEKDSSPAEVAAADQATPSTGKNLDPEWFAGDDPSEGGSSLPIKRKRKRRRLEDRQFFLAIILIGIYALGMVGVGVGWFFGIPDIATMAALVGNVGTLVAAVVAFYFAEPGSGGRGK